VEVVEAALERVVETDRAPQIAGATPGHDAGSTTRA
jgi:hypothetical protein